MFLKKLGRVFGKGRLLNLDLIYASVGNIAPEGNTNTAGYAVSADHYYRRGDVRLSTSAPEGGKTALAVWGLSATLGALVLFLTTLGVKSIKKANNKVILNLG